MRWTKFVVFFACFLDAFGIGLVFPMLSPLLLDPHSTFLPNITSVAARGTFLGIALGVYTLAQFFAAPILGSLSDRIGRRKVLMGTFLIATAAYVVGASSILAGSYVLLLLTRILTGTAAGSISTIYALFADIAQGREKTLLFGLLGTCWSIGFVIGPFAGGYFSSAEISPYFNWSTPFWIAALLSLLCYIIGFFFLKETHKPTPTAHISWLESIHNIKSAFQEKSMRRILSSLALYFLGWETLALFIPIFLMRRFQFDSLDIGYFYAYMGIGFALGTSVALRAITHLPTGKVLRWLLPLFGCSLLPLTFISSSLLWLIFFFFAPILCALIFSLGPIHVSNLSASHEQGRMQGILQSVQAGALALPPLLFGSIAATWPSFALWGAAAFAFLAALPLLGKQDPLMKE